MAVTVPLAVTANRTALQGWLLLIQFSFVMLLISGFRAPEEMQSLEPLFRWFKVLTRIGVLGLLVAGLTLVWRNVGLPRTLGYYFPFLAFCGWGILSVAWSPLKSESLGQVGSLLTLVLFSIAVSIYVADNWVIEYNQKIRQWLRWMFTCLVGLCAFLLLTGVLIPATGHMTRDGLGLGHSTNCGATASITLVLLVTCSVLRAWGRFTSYLIVGVPTCLLVIAISANRLSLIVALGLIAFSLLKYGGRYVLAPLIVVVAILGALYPIVDSDTSAAAAVMQKLNRDQSSSEMSSLSGRSEMWEAMWDSFTESPLIGHGFFVTSKTGEMVVWFNQGELLPVNWTAHNLWLQCLVTTGIIGLLLFLLALGWPLGNFLLRARQDKELRTLHTMVAIMLVWYGAWAILNESILGPTQPESVVFFSLLGLATGSLAKLSRSPSKARHRPAAVLSLAVQGST